MTSSDDLVQTPPPMPPPIGVPAATAPASPAWLPLAAVGVTLLCWASAFVAIRHLKGDFSPGALSLGRVAVGAVCLGAVSLTRGLPRPSRRDWVSLVTIGLLWFGIYHLALNEGERRLDAGTASMLLQVSPVLIALLAAVFLKERFTTYLALGLALAFSGVALIGFASSPGGDRDLTGVLLCLVSAVVYSISVILQKPLLTRLSALHVTWIACTVGAVACLPFAGQLVTEARVAPTSSVLWVLYLGVFPTAIAFTTYAFALQHMSASNLGVTTYLVPPITIVMGLVFLGETPPGVAYIGGVLALAGVAVARRTTKKVAPQPVAHSRGERVASMSVIAGVLVALVALLHAYFLVLEMFLWTKPVGRKTFGLEAAFAEESKAMAANQGLYNGFLVAGLVWGLVADRSDVEIFFLVCVIVAGAFGAATVSRRILFVQALPAALGLVAVLIAR